MRLLTPDIYLEHVDSVSPQLLKERGIKALILDVDNTLTRHNSQELPKEVENWIALMRQHEIKLMIASNNNAPRVEPFARKVGISAIPNSMKPLPVGYRKAQQALGLPSGEIAVVGDQVYTDIVGANCCGMQSIMVKYFQPESHFFFKVKRFLERPVIRRYEKIGASAAKGARGA